MTEFFLNTLCYLKNYFRHQYRRDVLVRMQRQSAESRGRGRRLLDGWTVGRPAGEHETIPLR